MSTESATIVVNISDIARKQVEGTVDVVRTMTQISSIAQSTRDGVEGTSGIALQLSHLSEELKRSISRFKVA